MPPCTGLLISSCQNRVIDPQELRPLFWPPLPAQNDRAPPSRDASFRNVSTRSLQPSSAAAGNGSLKTQVDEWPDFQGTNTTRTTCASALGSGTKHARLHVSTVGLGEPVVCRPVLNGVGQEMVTIFN